ncbi:hypothetical protein ACOSP7_018907 [Xanthoceras sorbifolium]|uniref:Uncharacterized protein n=1 Tax=Xanthoceras sorbifolium TaxID=99658 RepID=A0ABQ8I1W4_9ROSI|nr:hypothetical protein JRO89_XS05G0145300 [Xanthoceras sorbifolium]
MSLVDYASSSSDDEVVLEAEAEQEQPQIPEQKPSLPPINRRSVSASSLSSNQRPESSAAAVAPSLPPPPPSIEKLPDASLLLNSSAFSAVTGTDHASLVAAAMAESATRKKRDSNGLASTLLPRSKVPKGGTLPHTKNVLDTAGGLLVPPQISGRSNVVTEDISKLFVRRQADPSSQ